MKWEDRHIYIEKLSHKDCVRFALFCAKQFPLILPRIIVCIEAVERWLEGKATTEECKAIANNTTMASGAAGYAVYAIAYARDAGIYACNASSTMIYTSTHYNYAAKEEQMRYLKELLEFDEIAEKSLLGERYE